MLNTQDTARFLERVPLFQTLGRRQLELLAKRAVERDFPAGAIIVTQGRGGEGLFIVIQGKAEAVRERQDGERVTVNQFGPTDFFGELALLDDGPRTASVIAVEPTRCLVLSRWDFLAEVRQDAEMAVLVLQELAKRFRLALEAM
ncbi:MAG: cyclic nucleotide-binding domain-containing protein [Anaerolineae bacterium]|nr:cyclic nucleotide-binding domain-containing protein [Thermoflexales bacterium]MDW8407175.1 cyclic nucleotide-binding domain-containing protein [Anaerolineae bacterium]